MMTSTKTFKEYQEEKREREWTDKAKARKEKMNNAERVESATKWKSIGNDKFKAGNLMEAKDYYREAIIFVEDLVDARRKERTELLVPLYSNLAQVHSKLDENSLAEEFCGKVLTLAEVPRNEVSAGMRAKAHFRRALARRALGRLDDAQTDLVAALKLQPSSPDVAQELAVVKAALAEETKKAREKMGGFLQREADACQRKLEQQQRQEEKRKLEEERRQTRRANAEQRQQMQTAFEKLSKGEMLYEQREKEMAPVRKKEEEKKRTLELEQNLLNIIDESKGKPRVENFDDFVEQKMDRCKEQGQELDQKKKILDKHKKEQQWDDDDAWKGQRDAHRQRLEEERQSERAPVQPSTLWESREVGRWCEQRLRDLLVGASIDGERLQPSVVAKVHGEERSGHHLLRALVTDVLKLSGDAAVMRLNPHKPPLHYFDYFLKLEWEVAVVQPGDRAYRSADELIGEAAKLHDMKAPASIAKHRVLAGTFKHKEFSSEEALTEGGWELAAKVKTQCEFGQALAGQAEGLRDSLRLKVQQLLARWAEEYREHWAV